jgi:hypothetical protein
MYFLCTRAYTKVGNQKYKKKDRHRPPTLNVNIIPDNVVGERKYPNCQIPLQGREANVSHLGKVYAAYRLTLQAFCNSFLIGHLCESRADGQVGDIEVQVAAIFLPAQYTRAELHVFHVTYKYNG